jgi:uncharacterized protein
MLGKLARLLRMTGFDTWYQSLRDRRILFIAEIENRILLTRDTHLLRRAARHPDVDVFNPDHNNSWIQLNNVVLKFGLKRYIDGNARCCICNGTLFHVEKNGVLHLVPEYSLHGIRDVARCSECGHIFWKGTQFQNFLERLD